MDEYETDFEVRNIINAVKSDPIEFFEQNYIYIPVGARRDICYGAYLSVLFGDYIAHSSLGSVEKLSERLSLPLVNPNVVHYWTSFNGHELEKRRIWLVQILRQNINHDMADLYIV